MEHVRLCCLLCLLYLAETGHSQRSIAQEKADAPEILCEVLLKVVLLLSDILTRDIRVG